MAFGLFLVYLAATFIRPFEMFPDLAQFRPMLFLGITAVLVALGGKALAGRPLKAAPQLVLIPVLVLWAAFTVFATQRWLTGAVDTALTLSANLFIFFLLVFNLDTLRRVRITLQTLTLLVFMITLESMSAVHFGYRADELIIYETAAEAEASSLARDAPDGPGLVARVQHRGVLADPNDLAQGLIALMPLVFLARRPGETTHNVFWVWLPLSMMTYTVFLTRSRGGVLAFLSLIFLASLGRFRAVTAAVLTGIGATTLLALGVFAGRALGVDASGQSRTAAWREGWMMLKGAPIWGVGFGYFGEYNDGLTAHNSFVECFAEVGLVGYFLWLGTLLLCFQDLLQVRAWNSESPAQEEMSRVARALLLSLNAFLVAAFFLSRAFQMMLFLLLGLATAIAALARRREIAVDSLSIGQWSRRVLAIELGSILFVYVVMRVAP